MMREVGNQQLKGRDWNCLALMTCVRVPVLELDTWILGTFKAVDQCPSYLIYS